MQNKKLLIINTLTLIAFIFVIVIGLNNEKSRKASFKEGEKLDGIYSKESIMKQNSLKYKYDKMLLFAVDDPDPIETMEFKEMEDEEEQEQVEEVVEEETISPSVEPNESWTPNIISDSNLQENNDHNTSKTTKNKQKPPSNISISEESERKADKKSEEEKTEKEKKPTVKPPENKEEKVVEEVIEEVPEEKEEEKEETTEEPKDEQVKNDPPED